MGIIQKMEHLMHYELTPSQAEIRLIQRHKGKSFLHRIVTHDEKWI